MLIFNKLNRTGLKKRPLTVNNQLFDEEINNKTRFFGEKHKKLEQIVWN